MVRTNFILVQFKPEYVGRQALFCARFWLHNFWTGRPASPAGASEHCAMAKHIEEMRLQRPDFYRPGAEKRCFFLSVSAYSSCTSQDPGVPGARLPVRYNGTVAPPSARCIK
jgi:hypothetical protein